MYSMCNKDTVHITQLIICGTTVQFTTKRDGNLKFLQTV